ncbi:hypothetical protein K469DRAFT_601655 [Zopfia rhizophila CBS 207.26]|uniref:T6SS Phospholipase effector Tle1-like catalytic domain-containing protein n=1 Tax=Zopfia rhizophila CBS 207.26 TaxID=1314779 RepID=A0A6A6DFG3_9PEZI|nr:hypothetical protein K469DRAFT_601655 [Zopfia rhizophila CBS 207.26]
MITKLKSLFTTFLDQAIGTSFVHHVIACYKFIMRYYNDEDKIYIFGFSRGAYTARFFGEMISEIGLLSWSNLPGPHLATFNSLRKGTLPSARGIYIVSITAIGYHCYLAPR